MIPYTDFEFAISRWKARIGGVPQPVAPAASGTVQDEVPVATAPEPPAEAESGTVAGETGEFVSGTVEEPNE
ncbi:MAG: hypothetical protein JXP73_05945 [Deltaproteobacteria bacterium]|jgi:hypothetical protein|nr:hypothetical protein [Deltaproteobacteria bacterium]